VPRAALRVDDLIFCDGRIAHDRSPQTTGNGPELAGEFDGLEEESFTIGETFEEVTDLGVAETVVDVAVLVLDHGGASFVPQQPGRAAPPDLTGSSPEIHAGPFLW
jgi:hypothetical protein